MEQCIRQCVFSFVFMIISTRDSAFSVLSSPLPTLQQQIPDHFVPPFRLRRITIMRSDGRKFLSVCFYKRKGWLWSVKFRLEFMWFAYAQIYEFDQWKWSMLALLFSTLSLFSLLISFLIMRAVKRDHEKF